MQKGEKKGNREKCRKVKQREGRKSVYCPVLAFSLYVILTRTHLAGLWVVDSTGYDLRVVDIVLLLGVILRQLLHPLLLWYFPCRCRKLIIRYWRIR